VNFFGNRYTVSRGEITFFNTAVVQPVIDLDLETRVRGVIVYINLSGPLSRLNTSYRSDPPLQSGEIIALLTVGRAPASTSTAIPATPDIRSQTVLETNSSNALLGAALSNVVTGRMERFFGATRMKIDPQVTGMENVNQARLSIEQSISRDITLTFITNLGRTQQQIVRIEWDLSRQWQAVAVRDENGVLSVDFVYRKRFK
jgi:translocation and assembly module TamB